MGWHTRLEFFSWRAMSFEHLRGIGLFLRAAERGSFSAAGDATGLTASAVSKAVATLEDSLGARLFWRSSRGLELTDEGRRFRERCARIEAELEAARREVASAPATRAEQLRVLLQPGPARARIVPALPRLLAARPGLRLDVEVVSGVADLDAARAEVAVVVGVPPPIPGLMARRLSDGEYLTCASPSYVAARGMPVVPEDLHAHACFAYVAEADGHTFDAWAFANDARRVVVHVKPVLAINDGPSLTNTALAGQGVVHLPALNLSKHVEAGRLVRLLPDWYSEAAPVYVLIAAGRRERPAVRVFVDFLAEVFADSAPGARRPPAAHVPQDFPMHRRRRRLIDRIDAARDDAASGPAGVEA